MFTLPHITKFVQTSKLLLLVNEYNAPATGRFSWMDALCRRIRSPRGTGAFHG